jgi:hypothetical protein
MTTYIGIDFGTSNTHVAYCSDPGEGPLVSIPIKITGKAPTTTCVLWKTGADGVDYVEEFGTVAIETWSQLEPSERSGRRLAFGFKPDIAHSPRAAEDASAFLTKICQVVSGVHPAAVRNGLTIIGVPAEIGEAHRNLTRDIVRSAGFADAVCIDEPLGALAYHLTNGSLALAEAYQGVVVVDFGGGTLDLALVTAEAGLRAPWGEPVLGGRLFDDLFYQWLIDQNGAFEIDEREKLVVWQKECRELKESFSRRWAMVGDGMADFKFRIDVGDTKKSLRNASAAEFLERARAYRPSPLALNYFRQFGLPEKLAGDTPIDLLAWIRRVMAREDAGQAVTGRFGKVVLTGGSSEWPFMRRIAAEVFGVDPEKDILRSEDPEATIGSGLALYNALRARHRARRATLQSAGPAARDAFTADVAARLDSFASDVAQGVLGVMMPPIEAAFHDWYRAGGSLNAVEAKVQVISSGMEPRTADIVNALWRDVSVDLLRLFRDHLGHFLQANEMAKDVARYVPDTAGNLDFGGGHGGTGAAISGELRDFASSMTVVAGSIGTVVIAAVHLHLVVLIAVAHPLLAVLAGIGTLLTWLGVGAAVGSAVETAIKEHEFNAVTRNMLHLALSESRLNEKLSEGREAARATLKQKILTALAGPDGGISIVTASGRAFDAMISRAIGDLGVLEGLATRSASTARLETHLEAAMK